jgi:hypothetical protein
MSLCPLLDDYLHQGGGVGVNITVRRGVMRTPSPAGNVTAIRPAELSGQLYSR